MSDYLNEQFAKIRAEVGDLKKERVTYRTAEVTATSTDSFTADVQGAGVLDGIAAPPQFLPAVGDMVTLTLAGAVPQYQPVRIGEDAVSYTELAPEVTEDMLLLQSNMTTALTAANGKNKVTYSLLAPSGSGTIAGDPWFQRDGTGVVTGSWEWDGDSWEVRKFGDAVLNSLTAGKIVAGTMNADVIIAGRFTTALTGQRREVNSVGFQAYNSSNALTVNIDGSTNLMTGIFKTALSGRRVEIGASGIFGRISFYGPAGETGVIEAYTDPTSGVEAVRMVQPISGTWPVWNAIQFQTNDRAYLSTGYMLCTYGGAGGGAQAFEVWQASDRGNATTQPSRLIRLRLDTGRSAMYGPSTSGAVSSFEAEPGVLRMFVGDIEFEGSLDVQRHGRADSVLRSPMLTFRSEPDSGGAYYAALLKFTVQSDGASPRLEVRNTDDSAYGVIAASAFTVSSAEAGKEDVANLADEGLLDRILATPVETWRTRLDNGRLGPRRIGLVVERAPAEVVDNGDSVNLYTLTGLNLALMQRAATHIRSLTQRVVALEKKVALL